MKAEIDQTKDHDEIIVMEGFAKYLKNVSLNEALHKVRKISWERILDSETFIEDLLQTKPKKVKQTA